MNNFFDKLKKPFTRKGAHAKNAVRYFLIVVAFLTMLFFSNDFDLINVQQTAIVMAVGIDKEGEDFSVTSQIAVPSAGNAKGESGTKSVNVTTKGKTIAQALDKVNEKTGWYPKLVFCRLILLGESTASENAFDALDYFLQDEYIADSCLVAACEGKAETLLSTKTPIDTAGALAMEKVLSNHAQRVGTSLPNTLRTFAASYFGEAKSGFLPLVKAEPLSAGPKETEKNSAQKTGGKGENGGQKEGQAGQEEKVFSASETALYLAGKQIGKLTKEETFTCALLKNKLRLAAYTLPYEGQTYTLTIKRATPKIKLRIQNTPVLKVEIEMTAGVSATDKARPLLKTADAGDFPKKLLAEGERRIQAEVHALFEKCRGIGFDLCDAIDKLQKYENEHFEDKKDTLLKECALSVQVKIRSVR